jgi:hypothetical protein
MSRVFVHVKIVGFAMFRQLGVELCHVIQRWVLIGFAEMALDRATDLRRALERGGALAPPAKATAAIPGDRGFKISAGGSHQVCDPPAHAETEDADAAAIDESNGLKIIHRRADVFDDVCIARPPAARRPIVLTIRAVAMIEVRRDGKISFPCCARSHLFHKSIHAVLVLNHDDGRQPLFTVRPGNEQIHPAIVYA